MAEKNEKPYSSIVDAFLADREPDWKELDMQDAKKEGETQQDRTHQYVDTEFMDDIAESTSRHTPLWPTTASAEKKAQRDRLDRARGTHLDRMASKDGSEDVFSGISGVAGSNTNWHVATQHPEDYSTKMGDDESLFAEVTETLEAARSNGKVENKDLSDAAVRKLVHGLLNQGESPAKIAKRLEKLAEIELFNHQMATQYLQANAGLVGMAFLEPNTYMDKNSPTYERGKQGGTNSNDCVRQHDQWKRAGITPRAASVKQISACQGCQYFQKNGSQKSCNLYHLPVVANTAELSPIVNKLTAGVPNKQKRAALVSIANRNDGTRVSNTPVTPKIGAAVSHLPVGTVEAQARRVGRVVPSSFDQTHIATLHEKGHSLRAIFHASDKKFGTLAAGKALREFVASLKPDAKGQVVIAKADAEFLASVNLRNKAFMAAAKCASCPKHSQGEMRKAAAESLYEAAEYVSRVPHTAFHESNPDQVRHAHRATAPELNASVIERYHKKGHSLNTIYKSAAKKFGTAQASKAVKEFIASLKRKPVKIALSQIDCSFLKNKLADHNPIIGAAKCGSCSYRKGMHCGLTGGTLLSFPGMDKVTSNHTAGVGAPEDGRGMLNEYDLMPNSGRPGDVKMADINMNPPERQEIQMNSSFELGDIE